MSAGPCLRTRKVPFLKGHRSTGFLYRQTVGLWRLYSVLFLFPPLQLIAQTPSRDQLTGTWIGTHTEWDIDSHCPLAIYMHLNADSTYTLGMVDGSAHTIKSTWGVTGQSVRLDTIRYAPNLIRIENDLLRIGVIAPMVFRRFQAIPVDSARAYKQLVGCVWQSDTILLSLFANGRVGIENIATKQHTAHFWRLAQFGTSVFLVIRGNAHNEEGGYKALWQLSRLSGQHIQIIGWNGQAVATQNFRYIKKLVPGDSCRSDSFQPCSNCRMNTWNLASFERPDERDVLKQAIAHQYQPVCYADQSGLLHIRFVVNCVGQIGPAEIKGYGEDYCPKAFDGQLTDQFLQICQHMLTETTWLKTVTDPTAQANDVLMSITFRLKNGQLTDILP